MASIDPRTLERAVRAALEEDVGSGDVSTLWTVPGDASARAEIVAKQDGVVAGLGVARAVFRAVDAAIAFEPDVADGARVTSRQRVAAIAGPTRGILTAERTALNFLQRMSGIATGTARYCDAVAGTGARILDTRKTAPGLRAFDKQAVCAGGGENHRQGLFDMVLLKENHLAAAGGVCAAIDAVRDGMRRAGRTLRIGVEVESLDQLGAALRAGADWILLDNMSLDDMRCAVARVRAAPGGRPVLEASGNVYLDTVRGIAECGVDVISVGALTHSPAALDLSLLLR